jgi:hypothetical protein
VSIASRKVPDDLIAEAEQYLSEIYPPGRITGVATFRSRKRKW